MNVLNRRFFVKTLLATAASSLPAYAAFHEGITLPAAKAEDDSTYANIESGDQRLRISPAGGRFLTRTSCESIMSGNRRRWLIIRLSSANPSRWLRRAYSVTIPGFAAQERARRKAWTANLCPMAGTRKSALCVRLQMRRGFAFAPHSTCLHRSSCDRGATSNHRSSRG